MAYISSRNSIAGTVNASWTPPAAAELVVTTGETTGPVTIPAGALWIEIRNAGFVQDGDDEVAATVSGASWSVGRTERFEAMYDSASEEYKRLPEIEIDGNGSRVFYSYAS